jgi:molecular chaperone DnaK
VPAQTQLALGIDLGTSNSCVAACVDGVARVLADEEGETVHASVVSFRPDGQVLVGNPAKRFLVTHPELTVASAKRLIGRFFFSDEVRKAKRRCAYPLVEGPNSAVRIAVLGQTYSPQEISALVLKRMKAIAERALGRPVNRAVITVPAYFNDNQRQATRDAGEISGLNVLRIINEPTAAALAYGYGQAQHQRVAVFDLGGGTFDVSILELGSETFEVLGTAGDTYLGGDDIDDLVVEHLRAQFQTQHHIDLRQDPVAIPRLLATAEMAKRRLATDDNVTFDLPGIAMSAEGQSLDLKAELSVAQLSRMCLELLQRTFKVCDEALQAANMRANELSGVVLVGGPTRLPFVRQAVAHYFGQTPNTSVNPDEVVAVGAALQANALVNAGPPTMLLDVTPLTLRLATVAGYTEAIIDKNTPIPIERSRTFTTVRDNQDRVQVVVLQGEDRRQDRCELLGQFEFVGLRPAKRGEVQIEVTFEIDQNGIVHVSAKDIETGRRASTEIKLSSGLTSADIAQSRARNDATAIVPFEP